MSERIHSSKSSIPQIVSNMKMYLNFEQSDATGFINRLLQGITNAHKYPPIKPGDDRLSVSTAIANERMFSEVEAEYNVLTVQGNPDIYPAFCLLGKLLGSRREVLHYLEVRSEILYQRLNKKR